MTRARILSVSFSPIHRDSRVKRQLAILSEFGDVTTVGYGPLPEGAKRHIEIPSSAASLPQTPAGVILLAGRRHGAVQLRSPAERIASAELKHSAPFDLVVANDARALPIAFATASTAPVWADMHEWAPEENATNLLWRALVKPYMDALCRQYLPRARAITTVSQSIADLYVEKYGVRPSVVRNAGPLRPLDPSPLEDGHIRLVHSGIAVRNRNLEGLIDGTLSLDERFTLDLFLIGESRYVNALRARVGNDSRIRFHDPVPPEQLPSTLNEYDLGVFLLPPSTVNYRFMLPNKFFDYVQARIGIVFGPAIETDRVIAEHQLGIVTSGWSADDLADALRPLNTSDVARFKAAAHRAAAELSNEADLEVERGIVRRLLERT
jgi:glycosyltransferase involved in cell wall biosynthesis